MVVRVGSFVAAAVLCLTWAAAVEAADIKAPARIRCIAAETQALTDLGAPVDAGKVGRVDSWFANWVFSDENQPKAAPIHLYWVPSSPDGPSLTIVPSREGPKAMALLSWTEDSVLGVITTSDRLTAKSWLYGVNFPQETVIATEVQSNIAGTKGRVVKYSCDFEDKGPRIEAPASGDGLG
jgi:hypothetical protein